jgi:OOP family OmpA-OmpF porin
MGAVPERRGPVRWGAALALLLCASIAQAQEEEEAQTSPLPSFSLERLELNPGLGPLVLGSGELLPHRTLRVSLVGHYQRSPLAVEQAGERISLVQDRTTGWLALAYGVLPWLELDAQLSGVAVQQGGDLTSQGIRAPSRSGLGAAWLSTRVGLVNPIPQEAFHLAMELGAGLPVGPEGALAHDPGISARGRLLLGRRFGWVTPAFEAGILLRSTVAFGTSLGTEDRIGNEARFGAGLTVGRELRGEVAARAAFSWEQSRTSAEVMGGLRYSPSPVLEVFALAGTGFGAEPGTPRFRALAGLAFRTDADPRPEPEEVIYELVTPLPPRKRSAQTPQEGTPSSPETSQPPSSRDSAEPEPSSSSEGRSSAEPEPDTDGDGVVDAVDACARERGTAEQSGCPAEKPPLVTLTRERLVLHGEVFFDTGVSTLPGPSAVLDRLAQVLLEHPEIQRVVIEGHTDTVGSDGSNRTLSLARAETVRRYLIEKGVPGERLVARGFGFQRPVSSNATAGGREQNRRAELQLILGEPEPASAIQAPLR